MSELELVQTSEGQPRELTSRYGQKRTVRVGREWDVLVDGEHIGSIQYVMVTREQRTPGRTYVNKRWQSPGWRYLRPGGVRWLEQPTKKDAIDSLVFAAQRAKVADK